MTDAHTDTAPPAMRTREAPPAGARAARFCYRIIVGVCATTIAVVTASRFSNRAVWDDAYMFVRYADNLLRTGAIAWNPDGVHTFGMTSSLYLAILLPIRAAVPWSAGLAAILSSLSASVLGFTLVLLLVWRETAGRPLLRGIAVLCALLQVMWALEDLTAHASTGMDTTFVMAYVAAYLLLARWHEAAPTRRSVVLLALWGGVAFWARPDLLLYTTLVPAALFVFAPDREARRAAFATGALTALVIGVQLIGAKLYFGTPLPLSFYVKSVGVYGDFLIEKWHAFGAIMFGRYVGTFKFTLLAITAHVILVWMGRGRRLTGLHAGVLAATVLFLLYYRFGVAHIMGYFARFYYPTLPALAFLAVRSLVGFADMVPQRLRTAVREMPAQVWYAATIVLGVGLLAPPVYSGGRTFQTNLERGHLASFDLMAEYLHGAIPGKDGGPWREYWRNLDVIAQLPDDLIIASTEVGMLSALNPNKVIIDIAGLNTADFALQPFDPEVLITRHRPDLVYIPHWDYREMNAALWKSPRFLAEYDVTYAEPDGFGLGFALRRASPHYPALRTISERNP